MGDYDWAEFATNLAGRYIELLSEELAPRLLPGGFQVSPSRSGDDDELRFSGRVPLFPQLTRVIDVFVEPLRDWMGMTAWARAVSAEVGEVIGGLPESAQLTNCADPRTELGLVDLAGFNSFINAGPYGSFALRDESSVRGAADWVVLECVNGPVGEWFSQRDDLTKLLGLAKYARPRSVDQVNPDAKRLRAAVILCLLNERFADAAGLMGWYLEAGRFSVFDSFERASAFDAALCERFPGYAQARALIG
ncbi:hypothetical protein [Nocardia sp. NBC_01327]|uniref:hypothetical protein n=1 Tax=Nocardia sp. NBC_01327 TaxID=2903593 RepID=UPI002E0F45CA|nr:hypothetical protein OG326_30795 [Nocardia sp. NBC_01327]